MKLMYDVKPFVVTGDTKQALLEKVIGGCPFTISVTGRHHYTDFRNPDTIRVYTLEKRRKTVIRTVDKSGNKKSKIVNPNYWIAHVYDIPMVLARLMKLKFIQKARTFTLETL